MDVPPVTPLPEQHIPDVPASCDLTVTLTHPGQGDHAKVRVWLPLNTWNGRLQTIGGQAYAAGDYGAGLAATVKNGYAAATTDAGASTYIDTNWALNSMGQVNTTLLKNFASRSEQTCAATRRSPATWATATRTRRPASAASPPPGTDGANLRISSVLRTARSLIHRILDQRSDQLLLMHEKLGAHVGRVGMVIWVVALLVLAGCTGSTSSGGHASASGTPAETASSGHPSAAASDGAGPRAAPQLSDARRTFIKTGGRTGSHSFSPISHIQRGTLEVAVVCSGSGVIDVNIGSLVSYTAVCAHGDPGQYDEVGLGRPHRNVAVSVTSKTSGSRALSVGWTKNVTPRR
ncbi:hypothetical protein [Streptomyces sp. NPDC048419]|uniref:hypothetical protein n=1 Tax=Streptomyces sp. NPDC048419 TaxID=3365547 RepID=UPI0037228CE7